MRYILESIERSRDKEDVKKETVVNESDAIAAFGEATRRAIPFEKIVLWKEFDGMDEAPANEGCCYMLIDNDGRRTLRRCSAAQG